MKKETILKLKPIKFALSLAIILATFVLILTLIAITKPFGHYPQIVSLFSAVYSEIGYTISFLGAIIGAIYAFIDTFILAFLFAWLYNKIV